MTLKAYERYHLEKTSETVEEYLPATPNQEELAREWRDQELKDTDWIIPITDHAERDSYTTYRTALRDWPSTEDFPETRPTRS